MAARNINDEENKLLTACEKRNIEEVKSLPKEINLNATNKEGNMPIDIALNETVDPLKEDSPEEMRKCITELYNRECSAYKRKQESQNLSLCECSRPKSWHDDMKLPILSEGTDWKVEEHTKTIPFSYGEIKLQSELIKAKYACVDALMTDFAPLCNWMTNIWKLKDPDLIISINGSAKSPKDLSKIVTRKIKKGIQKIAYKSALQHIWIITNGFLSGVAHLVGEALKDFSLGPESCKVYLIGLCSWSEVNGACLIPSDSQDSLPTTAPNRPNYTNKHQLSIFDVTHTHFIFCNDGRETGTGGDVRLRPRFEKFLADKRFPNGTSAVIQIVIEGDVTTLEIALKSMELGSPVIFIEGSGRAGNILPRILSQIEPETDELAKKKIISKCVTSYSDALGLQTTNEQEMLNNNLFDMTSNYMEKCYVLNIDNFLEDLDITILSAVCKESSDIKLKLKLVMVMDRFDFAKEEVLTDDKISNLGDLNIEPLMEFALKRDLAEFVEYFLTSRVNLEDYASKHLKYLYVQFFRMSENKGKCVDQILSQPDDELTFLRICKWISKLAGREFSYSYSKSDHGCCCAPEESEKNEKPHFPERDLFFLCLITDRYRLAKLFCRLDKDPIALALTGVGIVKKRRQKSKKFNILLADQLNEFQIELEQLARDTLNQAYLEEKTYADFLLIRSQPHLGGCTSLGLANDYECEEFIYHPCCQDKLTTIWYGIIPNVLSLKKKILLIFTLQIFWILPFCRRFTGRGNGYRGVNQVKIGAENVESCSSEKEVETSILKRLRDKEEQRRTRPKQFWRTNCDYLDDMIVIYTAPVTKFFFYMMSYIAFLCLLTYDTLLKLDPVARYDKNNEIVALMQPNWVQYLIWIWFGVFILEEIKQALKNVRSDGKYYSLKQWFKCPWNKLDLILYLLFLISILCRVFVSVDGFTNARNLQCLCLSLFYLRFLQFFYANELLGPKVIIMGHMVKDLLLFVCIYFIILLAFGTMAQGLQLPNHPENVTVFKNVFYNPIWRAFGDLNLNSIEGNMNCNSTDPYCVQHSALTLVAFLFFLLFTNILLINMLIAALSFTFNKYYINSKKVWALNRFEFVLEFTTRSFLVPPFSILHFVIMFYQWMDKKCCNYCQQAENGFCVKLEEQEDSQLNFFVQNCMDKVWTKLNENCMTNADFLYDQKVGKFEKQVHHGSSLNELEKKLDENNRSINNLKNQFNEFEKKIDCLLKRIN